MTIQWHTYVNVQSSFGEHQAAEDQHQIQSRR